MHQDTINFIIALSLFLVAVLAVSVAEVAIDEWRARGDTVATVNGVDINEADVNDVLTQRDMTRFDAVQQLIRDELIRQRAAAKKITVSDDEVKNQIRQLAEQSNMTPAAFQAAVASSGIPLRERVKHQLLTQKLIDDILRDIHVTSDDVRTYYARNTDEFTTPPTYEVTMATVTGQDTARRATENICAYDCITANISRRSGFSPSLITTAAQLAINETDIVALNDSRYRVVRKDATYPKRTEPLRDVRDELRDALYERRRRAAVQSYFERIRANATITNYELEATMQQVNATREAVFRCIQNNATLYGARWDSQTNKQIDRFRDQRHSINYVECAGNDLVPKHVCQRAGIEAYPTWVIHGERHLGVQSVERIAHLADCV